MDAFNQLIYDFAAWVDTHQWSTALHESFYVYNWIESTHVVALTLSLGMLFLIDLRMLGLAMADIPASTLARRLSLPMFLGFTVMIITGLLLFYAIPVRSAQSLWLRIKLVLLFAAAINAWLFHRRLHSETELGYCSESSCAFAGGRQPFDYLLGADCYLRPPHRL